MKTIGLACDHAGFEKAGLTKTSEQTLPQV